MPPPNTAPQKSPGPADPFRREASRQARRKKILKFAGLVLVVALFLFAGYYFYQYRKLTRDPNAAVQNEIKSITAHISKYMDLPMDETPTLATVTDPEKLKSQPFFAKVQNGDKVLIYLKAKKAILYRPSANRIIEVTPLSGIDQGQGATGGQ